MCLYISRSQKQYAISITVTYSLDGYSARKYYILTPPEITNRYSWNGKKFPSFQQSVHKMFVYVDVPYCTTYSTRSETQLSKIVMQNILTLLSTANCWERIVTIYYMYTEFSINLDSLLGLLWNWK